MKLLGLLIFTLLLLGAGLGISSSTAETTSTPKYKGTVSKLSSYSKERMRKHSWRPGCPVPLRKLRSVRVSYWNFKNEARRGHLVIHRKHAQEINHVFRRLYNSGFNIRKIRPIDAYGGSDRKSMRADNTSAFNCRYVAGTSRWSEHAYGKALDINPRENPYVSGSHVSPPEGAKYVKRKPLRKGMIGKRVARTFKRVAGWHWGGNWSGIKDYQHFSANGS
jgi:hypothetical protein